MPRKSSPKSSTSSSNNAAVKTIFSKATNYLASTVAARYSGPSMGKNIARDMRSLKALLNTENKNIDFPTGPLTVTLAAPTTFIIPGSAEGSDNLNRTGRSVKLDRLDCILKATWNGGTTTVLSSQVFRWFVVKYKKTLNNTPFTAIDFLDLDSGGNISSLSLPNDDRASDYQILYQDQIDLQQYFNNSQVSKVVEFTVPLNFHQTYNGTTAASIDENFIEIVGVGMQTNAAGGASTMEFSFRTWFVDN